MISPLGADREATWIALRSGQRAGRWLSNRDLGLPSSTSVCAFMGSPAVEPAHFSVDPIDRVIRLAVQSTREALHDAGVETRREDSSRIGCVFGTSKGGLHTLDRMLDNQATDHARESWLTGWPSAAAEALAQEFALRGPCLAPVAACATGVVALVRGIAAIESGECDVVVAGSADDSLHAGVLASFQRLGVLTRGNDPQAACRPFDRSRSGFMVGAGAATFVLERKSHAEGRRTPWYAEVVRGRLGTDPSGMTQLEADGESLAHLIARTCDGVAPDVVQLHGTGTRANDPAECRAVRRAFGDAASTMVASGLKGALGHLLGAAGSVETALACLTLRDQIVPPCVNLTDVDPACDLAFALGRCATARVETLLKLSLGFGGHQAAVLLRRGNRTAS